jgi:methionyl-tRNA formyltransferase
MVVATGRGALRVEELQAAGRQPLPSDIYLRNNPGLLGARLLSTPDGAR